MSTTVLCERHTPPKRHRRNRFGGSDPETFRHALQQVRSSSLKERHGSLVASGAPPALDALNGVWRRSEYAPEMGDFPHYVKEVEGGKSTLHLFKQFGESGPWQIARSDDPKCVLIRSDVLARSFSNAHHPNTVDKGSWSLLASTSAAAPPTLVPCDAFDFWTDGPNTPDQPFLMEEIGLDFFIRAQPRKQVIWFEDPSTGQVFHSGAKKAGAFSDKPGNRYCPMCEKCFSANNFKSQHMRSHARSCDSLPSSAASTPLTTPLPSPLGSPNADIDAPTGFCDISEEDLAEAFDAMLPLPFAPPVAHCKSFDPIEELMKAASAESF